MEKNGNVGGIITVSLEEKDYQDKVAKDLKTIGQKHHIDGFRPGKVPAGLLKKMFGKQVLADVINRETVDALFKYIEDEKLSILGEPLPTRWRSVRMRRSHVVSVRKFLGMKSTRQPLSRVLLLSSTKTAA